MAVGKILIVDDEPSIVNVITAYLKPEGYEVFTASDGNQAIKAAHAFKPDLVILDIMLPGMDGIEVLTRLRRESAGLRHFADCKNRGNGPRDRFVGWCR